MILYRKPSLPVSYKMAEWHVKVFALHENPYTKKFSYHVFGIDKGMLQEFGRMAGCYERMFSVLDTHGAKTRNGVTVYHYDDWRKGVIGKYQELVKKLGKS